MGVSSVAWVEGGRQGKNAVADGKERSDAYYRKLVTETIYLWSAGCEAGECVFTNEPVAKFVVFLRMAKTLPRGFGQYVPT